MSYLTISIRGKIYPLENGFDVRKPLIGCANSIKVGKRSEEILVIPETIAVGFVGPCSSKKTDLIQETSLGGIKHGGEITISDFLDKMNLIALQHGCRDRLRAWFNLLYS